MKLGTLNAASKGEREKGSGGEVRVPGSPVKKFPGAFAFHLLDFGGKLTNEGGQWEYLYIW